MKENGATQWTRDSITTQQSNEHHHPTAKRASAEEREESDTQKGKGTPHHSEGTKVPTTHKRRWRVKQHHTKGEVRVWFLSFVGCVAFPPLVVEGAVFLPVGWCGSSSLQSGAPQYTHVCQVFIF